MRKKYGFYIKDEDVEEEEEESGGNSDIFMVKLKDYFESWRYMVESGLDNDSMCGFIDNVAYVDDETPKKRRYSRWIMA